MIWLHHIPLVGLWLRMPFSVVCIQRKCAVQVVTSPKMRSQGTSFGTTSTNCSRRVYFSYNTFIFYHEGVGSWESAPFFCINIHQNIQFLTIKMNNYTKMAVFCINIHFLEQMTTKSSKIVKKLRNCVISNHISKDKIYA